METTKFVPSIGGRCSFKDRATSIYYDAIISDISRRDNIAFVTLVGVDTERKVKLSVLKPPMYPDINKRFEYFERLGQLTIDRKVKSMIATGEGGIGKSWTIDNLLELNDLEQDKDYVRIKGHCTPYALYHTLEENPHGLFLMDDCDEVLRDPLSNNIMKAILDTQGTRRVKWMSKSRMSHFDFHGSVIYLSNLNRNKLDQAIISRSIMIDLYMNVDEKIERMDYILPSLKDGEDMEPSDRVKVLKLIAEYRHTISDLNVRTLIKALQVYKETEDMQLTQYQILNG